MNYICIIMVADDVFFHTSTPSLPGLYKMLVSDIKTVLTTYKTSAHDTKLTRIIQNSYNALASYSKPPHVIQSPPAHDTKLTHIIQSYHTLYKASIYSWKLIEYPK